VIRTGFSLLIYYKLISNLKRSLQKEIISDHSNGISDFQLWTMHNLWHYKRPVQNCIHIKFAYITLSSIKVCKHTHTYTWDLNQILNSYLMSGPKQNRKFPKEQVERRRPFCEDFWYEFFLLLCFLYWNSNFCLNM